VTYDNFYKALPYRTIKFMTLTPTLKLLIQSVHPLTMWVLLALTLYSGYLGFQISRTRFTEGDAKKELIRQKFNIRHHQISSLILALMVLGSIGGMAATYIINQKLFFGSHLIAGLTMTGMIAVSASLTPLMQKGNDAARYAHITLNVVLVSLFGWQAVTGFLIVQKILSDT
jgi:Protein of unknown function (DUF4079)